MKSLMRTRMAPKRWRTVVPLLVMPLQRHLRQQVCRLLASLFSRDVIYQLHSQYYIFHDRPGGTLLEKLEDNAVLLHAAPVQLAL